MGILRGALSARRYCVVGEAPSGARSAWADTLTSHGYREPASAVRREETVGWVHAENLLVSNFTDMDQWLFEPYAHFSLRIDKKVVPPALLKAHVLMAAQEWCEENGRTPCPRSVRTELREHLEDMGKRILLGAVECGPQQNERPTSSIPKCLLFDRRGLERAAKPSGQADRCVVGDG